ncbi:MAG: hypothetical protein ACRD0L_03810 [Acidimicrobiales bacterium]
MSSRGDQVEACQAGRSRLLGAVAGPAGPVSASLVPGQALPLAEGSSPGGGSGPVSPTG